MSLEYLIVQGLVTISNKIELKGRVFTFCKNFKPLKRKYIKLSTLNEFEIQYDHLSIFEQQKGYLSNIKVNIVLRFMGHIGTKLLAHNTMPIRVVRGVGFIKL